MGKCNSCESTKDEFPPNPSQEDPYPTQRKLGDSKALPFKGFKGTAIMGMAKEDYKLMEDIL